MLALLALVPGGFAACRGAEPRRPNIVLILGDDLGFGDVGFHGRTEWATPRLDALAKHGRVLDRCYTAAVVCAPSRAALMTGKSPVHSGVRKNDEDVPAEEITIAEALKPLGYHTGIFGKWHHGRPRGGRKTYVHPLDHGFDEFFGYTDAVVAWEKFPRKIWSGREEIPITGYFDDLVTDKAIDFIGRSAGKPFFVYLPLIGSHFNVAAPAEEIARHQGKFTDQGDLGKIEATYAAMVTRLDRCVGRVVDSLASAGLTENTLIVFASDHGATFEIGNQGASAALDSNHPFRGQKRTLWEGGVRVPGIASWPGVISPGVVGREVVSLTDMLPTFVAAAGGKVDPAWKLDGLDMLPVWRGQAPPPDRTLFWEWRSEGSNQIAALHDPFKLVITSGGKPELFDLARDPTERRDVSAQYPKRVQELRSGLMKWLESETPRDAVVAKPQ